MLLVDDDDSDEAMSVLSSDDDGFMPWAKTIHVRRRLLQELPVASDLWWLKRTARRRTLLRLAEECAAYGPQLRRRCAELRAAAAKRRLELLRTGQMKEYAAMVQETKDQRLQEVLDETKRILAELGVSSSEEKDVTQPKALAHGQLMPHQENGLRWLVRLTDNQMSGILADDMGLGKTVQTLSLLAFLAESRQQRGPHLVVSPMSTLQHWCDEILQWLPTFRFLVYRGNASQLAAVEKETVNAGNKVSIVLTNYETMASHDAFLGNFPWCCLVVDEGHRIKNHKAHSSQVVRRLPCRHRLLLTGTPIQNSLRELWSLLSFVAPSAFSSLENFEQWFALPAPPSLHLSKGMDEDEAEDMEAKILSQEEELLIIQRLHGVLRPFLLRRTKEQVLADLPPKTEVVLWLPLTRWQKVLYRRGLRTVQRMAPKRRQVNATVSSCLVLRKAVNRTYHYLSKKERAQRASTKEVITASGKFEFLDCILPRLVKFDHKILIFAQMTSSLDLLEKLLQRLGLIFTRIDGSKSLRQRSLAIAAFTQEAVPVMLLTTRAGGLGLNLQVADTVILFDSDWNPQADLQASDRAHRIGQTRPVKVIRLMTPTALDRGLLERNGRKLEMERKVIRAGNFSQDAGPQNLLKDLLREARNSTPSGLRATNFNEVNRLLARSEEERLAFEELDREQFGFSPKDGSVEEQLERAGRLTRGGEGRTYAKSARAVAESLVKQRRAKDKKDGKVKGSDAKATKAIKATKATMTKVAKVRRSA